MDKHDTVGIDCVAMCVNDIICGGASPLFFLDYVACGKEPCPAASPAIVSGVTEGCRQAGCALVGGETAEHARYAAPTTTTTWPASPSVMVDESDKIIDGSTPTARGICSSACASTGVHSNGFSLVRKVLLALPIPEEPLDERVSPSWAAPSARPCSSPTQIYVRIRPKPAPAAASTVRAISHITGGGLYENVPRMMREGLTAQHPHRHRTPSPPIFEL